MAFFSASFLKEILHVAACLLVFTDILIKRIAKAVAVKHKVGWVLTFATRRGAEVGIKIAAMDLRLRLEVRLSAWT